MGFKKDFVWGVASASYQVEGAKNEDGKGLSVWDVFCQEEGRVYDEQNGDIACDHYHKYKEDIKLMKELGIQAYRFSVSWPRILPDGTGQVNEKGLEFYDKLIDELVANGIRPYLTLYHWDLPYALQQKGGWLNNESPEWFYEYASIVAKRYSDRVTDFFTINEPQCFVGLGYRTGTHAPGYKMGHKEFFTSWHNVLKAHGRGVQALRQFAVQPIRIGLAPCSALYYPETNSEADIEAARRAMFNLRSDSIEECNWNIALCSDPIFLGKYPEELFHFFGEYLPEITEEDMQLISQELDFYGQNMYNAVMVRADENGDPVRIKRKDGFPKTAIQWPVTPECMYWGPKLLYERYKKNIVITENGMSSHDWISLDGKVHDTNRIDFMMRYLKELRRAANDGVEIDGYFAWTTTDNFEWSYGYSERFGLIYVDFETQERIIKDSGFFYRDLIRANGDMQIIK